MDGFEKAIPLTFKFYLGYNEERFKIQLNKFLDYIGKPIRKVGITCL